VGRSAAKSRGNGRDFHIAWGVLTLICTGHAQRRFSDNNYTNSRCCCCCCYKIHHTSTPVYLSHHIQPLIVTHRLRSSATPRVCKPTTRTNFADRAFRCCAPAVWNSLTADIVDSCSVPTFKRKLKTFLFRHAFSSS